MERRDSSPAVITTRSTRAHGVTITERRRTDTPPPGKTITTEHKDVSPPRKVVASPLRTRSLLALSGGGSTMSLGTGSDAEVCSVTCSTADISSRCSTPRSEARSEASSVYSTDGTRTVRAPVRAGSVTSNSSTRRTTSIRSLGTRRHTHTPSPTPFSSSNPPSGNNSISREIVGATTAALTSSIVRALPERITRDTPSPGLTPIDGKEVAVADIIADGKSTPVAPKPNMAPLPLVEPIKELPAPSLSARFPLGQRIEIGNLHVNTNTSTAEEAAGAIVANNRLLQRQTLIAESSTDSPEAHLQRRTTFVKVDLGTRGHAGASSGPQSGASGGVTTFENFRACPSVASTGHSSNASIVTIQMGGSVTNVKAAAEYNKQLQHTTTTTTLSPERQTSTPSPKPHPPKVEIPQTEITPPVGDVPMPMSASTPQVAQSMLMHFTQQQLSGYGQFGQFMGFQQQNPYTGAGYFSPNSQATNSPQSWSPSAIPQLNMEPPTPQHNAMMGPQQAQQSYHAHTSFTSMWSSQGAHVSSISTSGANTTPPRERPTPAMDGASPIPPAFTAQ